MFCSTIILTINRSTLSRAVWSILNQEVREEFEVIVVNDSGKPLPKMDWQGSPRVKILHTFRRERCVARNVGAGIANGEYLHFLDDDDWMLPGAFEKLSDLASRSPEAWLYGGYELVDNSGCLITQCSPDERGNCFIRFISAEWLPLQASLIKSEAFFSVGGFASLESLLGGDEDVDLARQIALKHSITGIAEIVAAIRVGMENSTTNYKNLVDQSRQSRERALCKPGALKRLQASADSRPTTPEYWHGRIVSCYLGSLKWNLRHNKLLTAICRGCCAIASLAISSRYIIRKNFWSGIIKPHIAKAWLSSRA